MALSVLGGCQSDGDGPPLVVISADSEEQRLLAQITITLLRERGYVVEDGGSYEDGAALRAALVAGTGDLAWAYTGETWMVHLGHHQPIADAARLFELVREEDAHNGIIWLGPAPAERQAVLLVTKDLAQAANLQSIEGLVIYRATVNPFVRVCAPEAFQGIAGLEGLERVYGLRFESGQVLTRDLEGCYQGLASGECECALGYSNDLEIQQYDLVPLNDGRAFFPGSNLALGVRSPALEAHPGLEALLNELTAQVTNSELLEARLQVRSGQLDEPTAARSFLRRNGLLTDTASLVASEQG